MGLMDKAKNVGRKGVAAGKKGVEGAKNVIRKKTCPECKYYEPIDSHQGDCPIGGKRLATADISTCPQKAFIPNDEIENQAPAQDYPQQQPQEQYPPDQQ